MKIFRTIYKKAAEAEYQYVPLGIVGVVSFIGYYFIWHTVSAQEYSNVYLRFIGGGLCFLLMLKQYWPQKMSWFLPILWYITLIYCFPFFFSFMLFHNPQSSIWLMTNLTGVFFLMLLVNWIELFFIIIIGIGLAWAIYVSSVDVVQIPIAMFQTLPVYFTVLIAGGIFIYRKDYVHKEKLETMKLLGVSIAHEMATPLRGIDSGVKAVKSLMMRVFAKCKQDQSADGEKIMSILDHVAAEADMAFMVIDMLLVRVGKVELKPEQLQLCSIVDCVEAALERYPFNLGERELVHWEKGNDFSFKCNKTLMVHVIFNLLKNALYYVKAAGKGDISIWLEQNNLHFKDTGSGISTQHLAHVFERFFTTTKHGTGTGLAFCKMVMTGIGGNIVCNSEKGEFAEFILTFPQSSILNPRS